MNTSDLIGPALDWAVAMAEGKRCTFSPFLVYLGTPKEEVVGYGVYLDPPKRDEFGAIQYCPGADWAQGGPIIERERLRLDPRDSEWQANSWNEATLNFDTSYGPTPLIAAMRAFVASKLGDEVDVPKELL